MQSEAYAIKLKGSKSEPNENENENVLSAVLSVAQITELAILGVGGILDFFLLNSCVLLIQP